MGAAGVLAGGWGGGVVAAGRFIGSLEDDHLKKGKAKSDELGIQIELGMRSVCPTSKAFDPKQGTAEQQIQRMIRAAKMVGSPIIR